MKHYYYLMISTDIDGNTYCWVECHTEESGYMGIEPECIIPMEDYEKAQSYADLMNTMLNEDERRDK